MNYVTIKIDGYPVKIKIKKLDTGYLAEADTFIPVGCVAMERKTAIKNAKLMFLRFRELTYERLLNKLEIKKAKPLS